MDPPHSESHGLTVTRIEALGFRSLRYVSQRLEPFHVLVGPNASGKSAFLDVLAFLGDTISDSRNSGSITAPRRRSGPAAWRSRWAVPEKYCSCSWPSC